jgi:hypothetical protein
MFGALPLSTSPAAHQLFKVPALLQALPHSIEKDEYCQQVLQFAWYTLNGTLYTDRRFIIC